MKRDRKNRFSVNLSLADKDVVCECLAKSSCETRVEVIQRATQLYNKLLTHVQNDGDVWLTEMGSRELKRLLFI